MQKIIIVDDEPNIAMTLENKLKKNNFEVYIARDGQEPLDILEKKLILILILVVMMPNDDGFESLKKLRQIQS